MKKIIYFCLVFTFLTSSTLVYAATETAPNVTVTSKNFSGKSGAIEIDGTLPIIDIHSETALETLLNNKLIVIYNEQIQEASKANAKQVKFSYKVITDGNNCYIPIYSTIVAGSEKENVSTINFNALNDSIITLETVMGPNGTKLANKFVSTEIKKNPDYNSNFKGVGENPAFYVKNNIITFLFDEYQITSGPYGMIEMQMNLSRISEITIGTNDYYVKPGYNIKMIPVRKVASGLGYEVGWDAPTKSVIIKKGAFSTKVSGNTNKYTLPNGITRELESAPENKNGQLYVPISFFEIILGASYSTDSAGNITFSQYN